jgi:hypothetical protein
MLRRAYRDLGHDVLLRAHVILRTFIRSGSDTFLPLSFVGDRYLCKTDCIVSYFDAREPTYHHHATGPLVHFGSCTGEINRSQMGSSMEAAASGRIAADCF